MRLVLGSRRRRQMPISIGELLTLIRFILELVLHLTHTPSTLCPIRQEILAVVIMKYDKIGALCEPHSPLPGRIWGD